MIIVHRISIFTWIKWTFCDFFSQLSHWWLLTVIFCQFQPNYLLQLMQLHILHIILQTLKFNLLKTCLLFLDNEEVTETISTTYETSSRNNIPDTVLLTSSVRAPSLPTVTISPSSSLSSTVSAGSLTTETVFGDINLVTRVRDTVLVFTTTTTRTGHTHEHRGADKCQY